MKLTLSATGLIQKRHGLFFKVLFPVFLLFFLWFAVLGAWIANFVQSKLVESAHESTVAAHLSSYHTLQDTFALYAARLKDPALNSTLAPNYEKGAINTITAILEDVVKSSEYNFVNIYDMDGKLHSSSQDVSLFNEPAALNDLAARIRDTENFSFSTVVLSKESLGYLLLEGFEPRPDSGDVLAFVTASYIRDDFGDDLALMLGGVILNGKQALVETLGTRSSSEATILQGDLWIATTMTGENGTSLLGVTGSSVSSDLSASKARIHSEMEDIDGEFYDTSVTNLVDLNGDIQGALSTMVPVSAAIEKAVGARKAVYLIGIGGLLFFCLLLGILLKFSLKGIPSILQFMEELSKGQLNRHVDIRSKDELGSIAMAINSTTDQLGALISRIKISADSVKEVANTMESVGGSLKEATAKVDDANGVAGVSAEAVNSKVAYIATQIGELKTSAENNLSSLLELSASVDQVSQVGEDLSVESEQSSSTVEEMATNISEISKNAESLTGLTGETSRTMSEMEKAIGEIASLTTEHRSIAMNLSDLAQNRGSASMDRASAGMKEISGVMSSLTGTASSLAKRSSEIEEVVGIISGVADQTKLLALNASILAAQAGVNGRGFAVVADEIQELATRTDSSIRLVADHVRNIQGEAKDALEQIKLGSEAVGKGVQEFEEVKTVLNEIQVGASSSLELAEKVETHTETHTDLSAQVVRSLKDVVAGTEEISQAVNQQKQVSHQINDMAQKLRQRSEEMRTATAEQATTLKSITGEVERTATTSEEIARWIKEAEEQTKSLSQAMNVIRDTMGENISRVKDLENAVTSLSQQCDDINGSVSAFHLN